MRKRLLALIAGTVLLGTLVGGTTLAFFTDSVSSSASFAAGTLDVQILSDANVIVSDADGPPLISLPNMAPGDGPITVFAKVKNSGSLDLRYNLSFLRTDAMGANDNALADALELTLERQGTGGGWRMVGTMSLSQWHGLGTSAWQPDQSPFQLAPGQENRYRIRVKLPLATGNPAQAGQNILSFNVNAVQTANNPLAYCTPGSNFGNACELTEGNPVAQTMPPTPVLSLQGHYYKLWLAAGDEVVISVVPQDPNPNLYFYIYPIPILGLEDISINPGNTVEQVAYTADSTGWHWVHIRANPSQGDARYTISYQIINN